MNFNVISEFTKFVPDITGTSSHTRSKF